MPPTLSLLSVRSRPGALPRRVPRSSGPGPGGKLGSADVVKEAASEEGLGLAPNCSVKLRDARRDLSRDVSG
eukprot:scaffold85921_cov27-Phaeocystis_antarctica.AAC.1